MAGKKKGEKGKAKPKAGKKAKAKHRLLTPQEIIAYYREHKTLPPDIQRRI